MALPRRATVKPLREKPKKETLSKSKPFPGRQATLKPIGAPGRGQDKLRDKNKGPKPGLGPAPAPTPAAPVGEHLPPDAGYQNDIDLIGRQEQSRLGELDQAERTTRHDYGIDDPTNPFSRAEGLKRAFLARQKAASAGLASQGQLYSGAHERALGRTRREEEQARAELRSAYEDAINQIGAARAGVKFDTEEQRNQAFEDYLARAPEADVDIAPEAPRPVEPGGGGQLADPGKQVEPSHVRTDASEGGLQQKILELQGRAKPKSKPKDKGKGKVQPKRKATVKPVPKKKQKPEALKPYRGR